MRNWFFEIACNFTLRRFSSKVHQYPFTLNQKLGIGVDFFLFAELVIHLWTTSPFGLILILWNWNEHFWTQDSTCLITDLLNNTWLNPCVTLDLSQVAFQTHNSIYTAWLNLSHEWFCSFMCFFLLNLSLKTASWTHNWTHKWFNLSHSTFTWISQPSNQFVTLAGC